MNLFKEMQIFESQMTGKLSKWQLETVEVFQFLIVEVSQIRWNHIYLSFSKYLSARRDDQPL